MLKRIEGKYALIIIGPGTNPLLVQAAKYHLNGLGARVVFAAPSIGAYIKCLFNIQLWPNRLLSTFEDPKVPVPQVVIVTTPTLEWLSSTWLERTKEIPLNLLKISKL